MYVKCYQYDLVELALKDTFYEPALKLWTKDRPKTATTGIVFGTELNVGILEKALKQTPELILMGKEIFSKLNFKLSFYFSLLFSLKKSFPKESKQFSLKTI